HVGVSVRRKDGSWYIFIRRNGERAALKQVDEDHARETQKAVLTAIAAGQFDIAAVQKKRELQEEESEIPTVETYYEKTFLPVYLESAVAESTAASYRNNFKQHINPTLGARRLNEIGHDQMEEFISNLVKRNLAKATIQTIIKDLCTLF